MQYHLLYNAAAHFNAQDKYPDGMIGEVLKPGRAGFSAVCWALGELSMQAELVRRDFGYDHEKPMTEEFAKAHLRTPDIVAARAAIIEAINRGLGDSGDEVDEVLLELQKKKTKIA